MTVTSGKVPDVSVRASDGLDGRKSKVRQEPTAASQQPQQTVPGYAPRVVAAPQAVHSLANGARASSPDRDSSDIEVWDRHCTHLVCMPAWPARAESVPVHTHTHAQIVAHHTPAGPASTAASAPPPAQPAPASPPPARSLPASLLAPPARQAAPAPPAQPTPSQAAALLQAAMQQAPHLLAEAAGPLVGFAGGAAHLQPRAGSLEEIMAAAARAEAVRRTQHAIHAAGPPPVAAAAERRLPPSLAQPSALTGGGAVGAAAPDAPDNRAAMQAVVDALSVCSSEPADPPQGALKITLLRHQRLALGWLLAREGAGKGARAHCPNGGIPADDQVCLCWG